MQNLRSVFAQGGRSMGSRNFSSPPVSGAGGRGLATGVWKSLVHTVVRNSSGVGIVSSLLFGFACYAGLDYLSHKLVIASLHTSVAVEAKKKGIADKEQLRLRRERHEELVAKAKRDLLLD